MLKFAAPSDPDRFFSQEIHNGQNNFAIKIHNKEHNFIRNRHVADVVVEVRSSSSFSKVVFSLFFSAPPTFIDKPRDQKVGLNGVVEFHCAATGNPPPSVFWSKEGSQLLMFPDTSYGHMHVNAHGTLRIQGVQREDAGFLVCSALSVAGSNSVRAFLQVRGTTSYLLNTLPNCGKPNKIFHPSL